MKTQRKKSDTILWLIEEIKSLYSQAGVEYDAGDIGCTVTIAMNEEQRADLKAMIEFLKAKDRDIENIAYNVFHDLEGLKAVYHNLPEGNCFSPRSCGYAKKVS